MTTVGIIIITVVIKLQFLRLCWFGFRKGTQFVKCLIIYSYHPSICWGIFGESGLFCGNKRKIIQLMTDWLFVYWYHITSSATAEMVHIGGNYTIKVIQGHQFRYRSKA